MSVDTFLQKEGRKPFSSAKAVYETLCEAFPETELDGGSTISVFHEGGHMADVVLYGAKDALDIETDGASPVHWLTVIGSTDSSEVVDFLDGQYTLVECRDDGDEGEEAEEARPPEQPPPTDEAMPPSSEVFVEREYTMFCESFSGRPGTFVEVVGKEIAAEQLERAHQFLAFYDENYPAIEKSIQKGCRNYLSKSASCIRFIGFYMQAREEPDRRYDPCDPVFYHMVSVKLKQGMTAIKMGTCVTRGRVQCTDIEAEDLPPGY